MNNIRKHRNNKFLVIRKNSYLSFMVECDMMNIENRYIWTIKIARFFMNREKVILQDMQKQQTQNRSIVDQIFQNPFIRDLPDMAALRGMYCRFIVGEEDVYVAFGYDEAMVYGEFIEARGTMIPESVVKKCGYFVPEIDAKVVCLFCETRKLTNNSFESLDKIMRLMIWMDRFTARCMKHGIVTPMYCVFDADNDVTENFVALLDNERVIDSPGRRSFDAQEAQYYKDRLIPEWPIQPNGMRPGFIGFQESRYAYQCQTVSEARSLYNSPRWWKNNLNEDDFDAHHYMRPWIVRTVNSKEEANFIMHGMSLMHIPCLISTVRGYSQTMQKENRFFRQTGLRANAGETVSLLLNSGDIGAFIYWQKQFITAQFSGSETALGAKLYYQPEKATYMFCVSSNALESVIDILRNHNIQFGYPCDYPKNLVTVNYIWLCTDINEMPRVLPLVHLAQSTYYHVHWYGLDWDSTQETRQYAKMGYPADHMQSLYVTSDQPAYGGKKNFRGHILSMDGTLSTKEFVSVDIDPSLTPRCIPIDEAVEKKLMIVRPELRH